MKKHAAASVPRRPIPSLCCRNTHISAEGHLKRSWPVSPGEFFRQYVDEPLQLSLEISRTLSHPKVVLHTNLLSPDGEWGEIEFTQVHAGLFILSVNPVRCGIFSFKLKYSPDKGATWFWDRTPYTKVIIDPARSREVRLYTLIPAVSGHLGDWKNQLSRIRDMGFNRLHLLPVTRQDVSESPYSAADLFAVDPSYLDPSDPRDGLTQFEDFVLAAREKEIGLCLDLVLNHIGLTSDMAVKTPEWIVPDKNESNGLLRAGCWHMNSWIKWDDLVRINYDHPEPSMQADIWNYMKAYALFWAQYADFTGGMVRLDNLHSSHPGFVNSLLHEMRAAFPGLVVQAEFFSDSNTLIKAASESELNLLLANPWEYPYAGSLREYLEYLHGIGSKIRFLTPVATHDTGAPAQLYGKPEALIPRYFVTALFSTGQTGLCQGAEYGVEKKIEFIGRSQDIQLPSPARFSGEIKKINAIHRMYTTFHTAGNLRFVDDNNGALLVALREDANSDGERFLLCANLDTKNNHWLEIPTQGWYRPGRKLKFHDLMTNAVSRVEGDIYRLELPPCGVRACRFEYC